MIAFIKKAKAVVSMGLQALQGKFAERQISQEKMEEYLKNLHPVPQNPSAVSGPRSLAVVVPCYLHAPFLPALFESLVHQTRLPDEVIFVIDRSPDDTLEVLSRCIQSQNTPVRFTILENETNLGQALSINRGVAAAQSEWIMVANDDDSLYHDCVEVVLALLHANQELHLLGSHCTHFGSDDELRTLGKRIADLRKVSQIRVRTHLPRHVPTYRRFNDLNMTHTGSTFRKSSFEAVGGYRKKEDRVVPFSDRDFQIRMNASYPVGVSYQVPFVFWRNSSSVDGPLNS